MRLRLFHCCRSTQQSSDRSFSSVVKHLESNYGARRQGALGFVNFARFLVKVIRPAGVKNFKVVMLKSLDYSGRPDPESPDFQEFIGSNIDPSWQPLIRHSARNDRSWTYVYVTNEKKDVKLLVITLQKQEAYVVQFKFSPEKLAAFMNDPRIAGVPLN